MIRCRRAGYLYASHTSWRPAAPTSRRSRSSQLSQHPIFLFGRRTRAAQHPPELLARVPNPNQRSKMPEIRPTAARPTPAPRSRPAREREPIGPFLHYLMAECGVSPHTLAAYRSDLMHFVRWHKRKR